jgi:hypothetical protein
METSNLVIQPYQSKFKFWKVKELRILGSLSDFSKHVGTPIKFSLNSNSVFFLEF